ncbi:hypothetical protein K432DRAFT_378184 [Lepidopterella palustris CBS 459.81]|uniref:Uncharacterized protein n=1 Tax=Lepidopterella palustris CBS 459.81 TaxID=1314670 RepID=A0A8E2EIX5_9PEZI|nr:hypothetical protein K432DRAFT_378184 [Lepidopterella palustris CBS 459.81]
MLENTRWTLRTFYRTPPSETFSPTFWHSRLLTIASISPSITLSTCFSASVVVAPSHLCQAHVWSCDCGHDTPVARTHVPCVAVTSTRPATPSELSV